jgi:hypothetical protein
MSQVRVLPGAPRAAAPPELEDDGALAVDEHPVLEVGTDGPSEHQSLQVPSDPGQVGDLVPVGYPRGVLLDDRPGVEILGDVVRRRPDQLDAPLPGSLVGIGTREGRQEAVMDVDGRAAEAEQKFPERICM